VPAAVGICCALVGAVLLVVRARAAPALALIAFTTALVLLPLGVRTARAAAGPLVAAARAHTSCTVEVTVSADPHTLAARGVSGGPRVAVEAAAESITVDGRTQGASGSVLVLADLQGWAGVLPGQRVRLRGTVVPDLGGGVLTVTLFQRGPPVLLGRPPWWQRAAGQVRGSLRQAADVLPAQERGLFPGLIDGDTSGLDPVLAEHFRLAGLTHLVAVSGTNCSLILGAVLLTARRLRARRGVQVALGLLALAAFVVIARPSPSVLRAAVMALVALGALASGRPRSAVPLLAAAVLGLVLWDPTLAVSASFAMSVLATAAIMTIAPGWARRLRRRRVPVGLAEAVAVAAAAHLVTAPVVAALSGQVSVVAIVANVLVEPVVAAITVLGFTAALVAPVWLDAARVLVWIAGWPCRWLVLVADRAGSLKGATIPWPGGTGGGLLLCGVLLLVVLVALHTGARRTLAAMAVAAVVMLIPVRALTSAWPPAGWVFAACDVGQGDALLLRAGPGSAVEIDAGPDPVTIDRCLRDFGISSVPLLVLTHFHLDHVGGLPGVVRGRSVGGVVSGPLADPEGGVAIAARVAAQAHAVIRTPSIGTHLQVGDVGLDVVGPTRVRHGTRSDPNNASLTLRATVRGTRILLPGDAEIEEQSDLLASGADLRADILKIPHHGSAYSSPAFLAAVHAEVGVISVGAHNDYGHPSPVLLGEMARLGVPLLRTDRDGDVAFTVADGRVRAVVHGVSASTVGLGAGARGPPEGPGVAQ
jgi:competence protein ComEC